ncbi:MAG: biotin carboxylase N-terminal domain-containing protein, partial [Pseudolabrys sp.]
MRRVLVANRGEIALRAIRACRQLGHESLAVFSSADANSPHRWAADHAICIGPPPATASYLNAAALLETAIAMKCDAVYPGYGFLAENSAFAERCCEAGLIFIGPDGECI